MWNEANALSLILVILIILEGNLAQGRVGLGK